MPAPSADNSHAPQPKAPAHTTSPAKKSDLDLGRSKTSSQAPPAVDPDAPVRLHITPFTPALLKVYIAPSVLPLAKNISYHATETFPEKGFGYVELPAMEAQKLKKKLNGSTLKGSKVRIEEARPEKRKALAEADAEEEGKKAKKVKKAKAKKEQGVLEGIELPEGRMVKRGWTEPSTKKKKERSDKKEKKDKKEKDKSAKKEQKPSKYTREPELLFNARLTPVAATEKLHKEKDKAKKPKREKNKKKSTEVTIHEFEHNTKVPSFLKSAPVKQEDKVPVEYINGKGWVAADGTVVEPETARARNRRALELVDPQPAVRKQEKSKKKAATPPPESSDSELDEESSVVSSSSEDPSSSSDAEPETSESESDADSEVEQEAAPASPAPRVSTPSPPAPGEAKEVHPLEALFKRPKPMTSSFDANTISTPPKGGLAPINTSFSFFDTTDAMDTDGNSTHLNEPVTPFTQKDTEWRGLRSGAPTPDTAAINRRFSFDWRKENSQELEEDEDLDEDEVEASKKLSSNTMANALAGVGEKDDGGGSEDGEKEESEFGKWFWENRGDNNRAWKKRRREAGKAKRLRENRRLTSGRL